MIKVAYEKNKGRSLIEYEGDRMQVIFELVSLIKTLEEENVVSLEELNIFFSETQKGGKIEGYFDETKISKL